MAKVVDFEHYAYVRAGWADMRMRRPAGRDMRIHGPPARGYARAYEELVGPSISAHCVPAAAAAVDHVTLNASSQALQPRAGHPNAQMPDSLDAARARDRY